MKSSQIQKRLTYTEEAHEYKRSSREQQKLTDTQQKLANTALLPAASRSPHSEGTDRLPDGPPGATARKCTENHTRDVFLYKLTLRNSMRPTRGCVNLTFWPKTDPRKSGTTFLTFFNFFQLLSWTFPDLPGVSGTIRNAPKPPPKSRLSGENVDLLILV